MAPSACRRGRLVAACVVADGVEVFRRERWVLTDGLIAGHAPKHVVTTLGAVPLLSALRKAGPGVGLSSEV